MLRFVKYVRIVDKDIVGWRQGVVVGGDDCGWWCVLKEVLDVQLSMRMWYRLGWVWLERCRDCSYAIDTLHYDVWVICARLPVCIVACFIGFGEVFLWKCIPTYWQSTFSLTCFGAFLGGGNK